MTRGPAWLYRAHNVARRILAKLPRARVDDLVNAGKGKHFDPGHGRLMKEWIAVDAGAAHWVSLAGEAYQFVRRETA